MPLPESLTGGDVCALADRWTVSETTMRRAVQAADLYSQRTGKRVSIISGARSDAQQNRLRREGRPVARNDVSTHLSCPATGIDISLGFGASRFEIVTWGEVAMTQGLRWGGGGRVNEVGVPLDWQHIDRGPRKLS